MSNERRIYKYNGTLIGDSRVDSLDIDKLNTITPYLSYNSDSSSLEIGTNLEVDGVARLPHIVIDPTNDETGVDISFTTDDLGNAQLDFFFMSDGLTYTLQPSDGEGLIVTSDNLKTFFGNKSIVKDPTKPQENNIDLYNHFIELQTAQDKYFVKILSSSNVDCTGVGTKLKDLLKCVNGTPKFIDSCFDLEDGTTGCLYFDGTNLTIYINNQGDNMLVSSVKDTVETL